MLKQIFAALLVAMCLMHSATAIKCYQCKSLTDPNCAKDKIEPNMGMQQVDCEFAPKPNVMDHLQPVTRCNKVITMDRAGTIVSRDCHFEVIGQKENECKVSHSVEVKSCFTCKGDLCNGSEASGAASNGASGAASYAAMSVTALLAFFAVQMAL